MKVQEFIDEMNKNKNLNDDQKIKLIRKLLTIKSYIPFLEKKEIINDVIKSTVQYENGIYKFDNVDLYLNFTMRMIASYTDLEISKNHINDYDLLCENCYIDLLMSTFDRDYQITKTFFKTKCDDLLMENSLNNQIGKVITDISGNIFAIIHSVSDKMENFLTEENMQKMIDFQEELHGRH